MAKRVTILSTIYLVLFAVGTALAATRGGNAFLGLILSGICIVRLVYALLLRWNKRGSVIPKILIRLLSVTLCLTCLLSIHTGYKIISAVKEQPPDNLQYVILLGAGVNDTEPSLSLRERLDTACVFLNEHPNAICIVSGGKGGGESISEAECMFRYLTEHQISESRIWQETRATTTKENISYSISVLESELGYLPDSIGIITSEYHIYRAKMFAENFGISPYGIPAKTSYVSVRLNYFLREIFAIWFYSTIGG